MAPGTTTKEHQPRGAQLIANLPNLQNLIKRDPNAYLEEFSIQWAHYESVRQIFELGLTAEGSKNARATEEKWRDLVTFIAQVAPCYPKQAAPFPSHLSDLLLKSHTNLSADTKKTLVQSLVLLRNRGMLSDVELLKVLFPLLGLTSSPNLRTFILKTILSDIKTANKKSKNHKLNRLVQGLLFDMVERGIDSNSSHQIVEGTGTKQQRNGKASSVSSSVTGREAMLAVKMSSELWRKNIWNDSKTVQIVAAACFHPNTKVQSAAIHFFLATEEDEQPEESDEETEAQLTDLKRLHHQNKVNKSRKSTKIATQKIAKENNKKRKRNAANADKQVNFSAIHLLNDSQTFAEKLYDSLSKHDKHFTLDHKVLIMQLFGRLNGLNKLCVLPFYGYVTKYLTHHQLQITSILVSLASSVHELTPPDVLLPVVRKLANEFVHPGVATEVIAAGLNAIREICKRQPLAMEKDLLEDLIEYRKSKDKGVMIAARGLLQLYREVDPAMLRRRERGKAASMGGATELLQFGHQAPSANGIEGLELLHQYKATKLASGEQFDENDESNWVGWEEENASDSDNSEGGWINVSDDDRDIHLTDSEDEDGGKPKKRSKTQKMSKSKTAAPESDAESEEESAEEEEGKIKFQLNDSDSESEDEDEEEESDGESEAKAEGEATAAEGPTAEEIQHSIAELMSRQILTPADFAKLNELRMEAAEKEAESGGGSAARRKLKALAAAKKASEASEFLNEAAIIGFRKHEKDDYETRMASIAKGREGRDKFGSKKGLMKKLNPSSTTNTEKKKTKAYMMIAHSNKVRSKKHASLRDKQKQLRGHIKKQKNRMK